MRNVFLIVIVLIFASCSGSDVYRGNWKATNEDGNKLEITFSENDLTINENGESKKFEYSQNSINITNSVETYGIQLDDGKSFQIHFPIPDDESKGAILDASGRPLFIISRNEYLNYEDVFGI